MSNKILRSSLLGLITIATASFPFAFSTSCSFKTTDEQKEFRISVQNGFSLSNKNKAKQGESWASDLLINSDNNKTVVGIEVKQIDGTILQLSTDYSWTWDDKSESIVGQININNPKCDIVISVKTTEKDSNIVYDGTKGYVYLDCNDDFEFTYLDSTLPKEDIFTEVTINSIVTTNRTQLDPEMLVVNSYTCIDNRQFNVSLGINEEKCFIEDFEDCYVNIKFTYEFEQNQVQNFVVSDIPIQINNSNKGALVLPIVEPAKEHQYIYVTEDTSSMISISFILNEKRAPIGNEVYVSFFPQYAGKIQLLTPVCTVQPFHDLFYFSVSIMLNQDISYISGTYIDFGLKFQYSKTLYTDCDYDTSNDSYKILYITESSFTNIGDKELLSLDNEYTNLQLKYNNPSVAALENLNSVIKITAMEGALPSSKVKVSGNLSWNTKEINNFTINVPIAFIDQTQPSDRSFTLKIEIDGVEATSEQWTSPTYYFMACKQVPYSCLHIEDGVKLKGFNDNFNSSSEYNALVIPHEITEISADAFKKSSDERLANSNVKWLILPNEKIYGKGNANLTTIGKSAFESCSNLIGQLYIPASVQYIKDYAFKNCTGFNELMFATGLYHEQALSKLLDIGIEAFYQFGNPASGCGDLILPNSLGATHHHAFQSSKFSGTVSIVGGISTHVFEFCNLSKLVIPSSVSIQDESFHYCQNLKTIDVSLLGPNPVDICKSGGHNHHFQDIGGGSGTILVDPATTDENLNEWKKKFFSLPAGWIVSRKN